MVFFIILILILAILLLPILGLIFKFGFIIISLSIILFLLKKRFKTVNKLQNWESTTLVLVVGVATFMTLNNFGLLALGALPLATQQPLAESATSPIVFILSFIIFVLALMYIYKK